MSSMNIAINFTMMTYLLYIGNQNFKIIHTEKVILPFFYLFSKRTLCNYD